MSNIGTDSPNLKRQKKYHRKKKSFHHERLMVEMDKTTHRLAQKLSSQKVMSMQTVVNEALSTAAADVLIPDESQQFGCWLEVPAAQALEHIMAHTGMTQSQAIGWALRRIEQSAIERHREAENTVKRALSAVATKSKKKTLWQKFCDFFR